MVELVVGDVVVVRWRLSNPSRVVWDDLLVVIVQCRCKNILITFPLSYRSKRSKNHSRLNCVHRGSNAERIRTEGHHHFDMFEVFRRANHQEQE